MNHIKEIKKEFGRVYAACLYGSKVAGYASKGSDTDVIVVLKKLDAKIKYVYKGNYSFLAVDKKAFEDDVFNAKHGEFIAARICNPMKPIINKMYMRRMEIEAKKRIVLYNTYKLVQKHRKKAMLMEINALFFPFKQWSKMVQVYPPVRYSIENTLRNELREKNLAMVLPGYVKAIKKLKILARAYPGWYKIREDFIKKAEKKKRGKELARIYEGEIKRAVKRYKAHKKAGAGQEKDTIIYEITHKIEREIKQLKRKGFKTIIDNPDKYVNFVSRVK